MTYKEMHISSVKNLGIETEFLRTWDSDVRIRVLNRARLSCKFPLLQLTSEKISFLTLVGFSATRRS